MTKHGGTDADPGQVSGPTADENAPGRGPERRGTPQRKTPRKPVDGDTNAADMATPMDLDSAHDRAS